MKVVGVEGEEGEMKSCVLALAGRCARLCVRVGVAVCLAALARLRVRLCTSSMCYGGRWLVILSLAVWWAAEL